MAANTGPQSWLLVENKDMTSRDRHGRKLPGSRERGRSWEDHQRKGLSGEETLKPSWQDKSQPGTADLGGAGPRESEGRTQGRGRRKLQAEAQRPGGHCAGPGDAGWTWRGGLDSCSGEQDLGGRNPVLTVGQTPSLSALRLAPVAAVRWLLLPARQHRITQ